MTQWGLDTLFNPAKRHMDEEKRRLQSTRSEVGDNSGGKRIDLDSGKVVIHTDAASDGDAVSDADTAEVPGEAGDAPTHSTQSDAGSSRRKAPPQSKQSAPSAAAVRAAQRRGRTAR